MDDKTLLNLIENDPNAGIEQLINQYGGIVYTVIKNRLDGFDCLSSDIEDCVADVFSNFFTEIYRYNPEKSSIKTYLCVMARNHAINLSKKRSYLNTISLDDVTELATIIDDASADNNLQDDELKSEVIKAVVELGEPDSSIIFRKYYYGESSKDISKALGLSVSNVDTRTHRALNKLRKMFGGSDL